jgi:hypothetical protein
MLRYLLLLLLVPSVLEPLSAPSEKVFEVEVKLSSSKWIAALLLSFALRLLLHTLFPRLIVDASLIRV